MREKIKYFSKGDFQIKKPDIIFTETNLVFKIGEGEIYLGSFRIENQSDGDIRGLVYPSSCRMQCNKTGFQGNPVEIEFQYDGNNLKPGHVEKGTFTIICNGGEYEISFTAIIEKPYVMTSQGKIQDLRGFKKLAFENFDEALRIFRSRDFYELIKYEQPKIKNLYDNMRKWNLDGLGMEEFLVGIKHKEKIFLTLEAKERVYKNLDGKYVDTIELTKNTWGYVEFNIYSDCDFLEPDVSRITSLDFTGMNYSLKYTISSMALHLGRNFGRIIIETAFEKYVYTVEVNNSSSALQDSRKVDFIKAHLTKTMLRLQGGFIEQEKWKIKNFKLINELQVLEPENYEYKLYQAHVYLYMEEHEEAKWILENYHYSKFAVGRNVEVDAYYLFLNALQKRESTYTKKVVDELQRLYLRNPKSWKILCMLIQIDPYYNDYYERKHALENQFELGANRIPIYSEALKCFNVKATNLKKLGNFEIQVLRFAIKYKLLSKELALYVANLASQQKMYDRRIVDILEKSYDLFPDYMILTAICSILIKGNETSEQYFRWYELAIEEDVKIAKVFEYYMETVPNDRKEPLPRTILLYFAHGHSLPYDKVALIYANIIMYENKESELFALYKDAIKVFTMQQLELRMLNSSLKVLYRYYLSDQEMNIEKIKAIYDISHLYQITTKVSNIRYVLVIANDGGIYQKIPYTEHGAQVLLDSKDDIIAWERNDGTRYVGSVKYQTERLFYESKYIEMCKRHQEQLFPTLSDEEEIELSMESIKIYGIHKFDYDSVLALCLAILKSTDAVMEEKFLVHVLFELFKCEIYDVTTLAYLEQHYHGGTRNMKELWYAAKDYEVETEKLSERIVSQMLFTEMVVGEEDIFREYYLNEAYFRVVEAHMAFICREYLTKNKVLSPEVVELIMDQLQRKFEVTDVIKIAMLKYFSTNTVKPEDVQILKLCMQELCEKQIYFKFYMNYGKAWLREVQLWDKTLVTYTSKFGGIVKLMYQLVVDDSETKNAVTFEEEVLLPVYDTIYVKKFLIFKNECLRCYFKEISEEGEVKSEIKEYRIDDNHHSIGKYGRLNEIISNPTEMNERMTNYALEEMLASKMFVPYE